MRKFNINNQFVVSDFLTHINFNYTKANKTKVYYMNYVFNIWNIRSYN